MVVGTLAGRSVLPVQLPPDPSTVVSGKHWLLTVRVSPTGFTVVDARQQEGPVRNLRGHSGLSWRARLEDPAGAPLQEIAIPTPQPRRAEWVGPTGQIEAAQSSSVESVVTLRLPVVAGATHLHLYNPEAATAGDLGRAPLWAK